MEKTVKIKTENGYPQTFNSEGTIKNYKKAIEEIKKYNSTFNSIGVDYDYFLRKPQMVKVHSITDQCVKDLLGEDYNEIIQNIRKQVEANQCHYNAGVAGLEIYDSFDSDIEVYFCGGFFGNNEVYNASLNSHCIIYIENNNQGVFIDPTELVWDELFQDKFQLFYFAHILHATCDLFDDYGQAYNPVFGYFTWDVEEAA